jgi:hypothetical protein
MKMITPSLNMVAQMALSLMTAGKSVFGHLKPHPVMVHQKFFPSQEMTMSALVRDFLWTQKTVAGFLPAVTTWVMELTLTMNFGVLLALPLMKPI